MYTLTGWILCYINYFSIKNLKIKTEVAKVSQMKGYLKNTSILRVLFHPPGFYCEKFQTYSKVEEMNPWIPPTHIRQLLIFCNICLNALSFSANARPYTGSLFFFFLEWIMFVRLAHTMNIFFFSFYFAFLKLSNNKHCIKNITPDKEKWNASLISKNTTHYSSSLQTVCKQQNSSFDWRSIQMSFSYLEKRTVVRLQYRELCAQWVNRSCCCWIANKPGVTKIVNEQLQRGYKQQDKKPFELGKLINAVKFMF